MQVDAAEPGVAEMALHEMDRLESRWDSTVSSRRVSVPLRTGGLVGGSVMLATAAATSVAWLGWRVPHLGLHPVALAFFVAEVVSLVSGIIVGLSLSVRPLQRPEFDIERRESFRFGFAVADAVGRPRPGDLRADMARSWHAIRGGDVDLPELATAAVLCDGPRRLMLVVSMTFALLLGVAPFEHPPIWAAACGITALMTLSIAHVLLSARTIRFGDRVRWSSAALGEVCAGTDHEGLAPRRWVGTVAAVVTLNLAIGLRGMSDRWTHGLAPMTSDGRLATMVIANLIVLGGLYTLRTTTAPQLDNAHLVSRRTEERTARQSALGATVALSMIGLLAGVLPGNFESTDDGGDRGEQISGHDIGPVQPIEVGPTLMTGGFEGD